MIFYPEVGALNQPAKKLVVFLHGVGSDGHDLISLAQLMQPDLPDCHFISPHGIEPFDSAPFGRQWFSLENRDPIVIRNLIDNNAPLVATIIQEKQASLNISNKDTIIIGFSQGTMIGLYLNFIQKDPFYRVVGFSGLLVPPKNFINTTTPICLIHGKEDDVIAIEEMYKAANYLQKHGLVRQYAHEIQNLGHTIDNNGINLAVEFIKSECL